MPPACMFAIYNHVSFIWLCRHVNSHVYNVSSLTLNFGAMFVKDLSQFYCI